MVNEDHKRCSTDHVHGKAFPVTGYFDSNVKKEKSYSKFGFFKNGEMSL